jgi:hypothetical protein
MAGVHQPRRSRPSLRLALHRARGPTGAGVCAAQAQGAESLAARRDPSFGR